MSETGEDLMMNKFLMKHEKEISEPTQRNALFRAMCKSKGKCYKMVIYSGSTNNIVSIDMVEKVFEEDQASCSVQSFMAE